MLLLSGVARIHDSWPSDTKQRFKDLVLEKTLTCWLHDVQDTGFHSVTLVDPEFQDDIDNAFIHKVLIKENLAKRVQ